MSLHDFINDYGVVDMADEARLRSEIYQSKKRWFFIGYYADQGECFPMEVRPQGLSMNDYTLDFNQSSNTIVGITNNFLGVEIKFHDLTL